MGLNNVIVNNAQPKDKSYKLADAKGLFLFVHTKDYKYWRYKYRIQGKEKQIQLGAYPDISLKDARNLHNEAHRIVSQGIDPIATKIGSIKKIEINKNNLFEVVTNEWFQKEVGARAN